MNALTTPLRATTIPWLISGCGVLISVGFMVAAGVMNWRYGIGLGRTLEDQYLYGGIHILIDVGKVLLPFFCWWAWQHGRVFVSGLAAAGTIGLVALSVTSIAGFVDMNRAMTTGTLVDKKDSAANLRDDLARIRAQRAQLGQFEPATVVQQRLEQKQQDRRWQSTRQCTQATAPESRDFCSEYKALEAERAKALSVEKLDEQIAETNKKLTETAGVAAIDRGDPRAAIVSRVSGWELLLVQTWLSLLQVGIIEFMSTFGIFLSLNHGELRRAVVSRAVGNKTSRRRPKKEGESAERGSRYVVREPARPLAIAAPVSGQEPPFGEVAKFAVDCLRPQPGSTTSLADLYPRYRTWCDHTGSRALHAHEFASKFLAMCESFGFSIKHDGNETYCLELALTDEGKPGIATRSHHRSA